MTGLLAGKRVSKADKIIEAIGTIDELIAWLGILHLNKIQSHLMEISSVLAGGNKVLGSSDWVLELEREIDRMQEKLPELRNFILPQNDIHIARAVCRRAERAVVSLEPRTYNLEPYFNRLSDYLFVLARWTDWKKGKKELIWKNERRGLPQKI